MPSLYPAPSHVMLCVSVSESCSESSELAAGLLLTLLLDASLVFESPANPGRGLLSGQAQQPGVLVLSKAPMSDAVWSDWCR